VGGFHTEYSSIRFALFFLAEYMNLITMSAIIVTLFLGGPSGPAPDGGILGVVVPVLWFLGKVFLFLFAYVWLRATLPRIRYDQLMDLGWKKLIPASLVWLLVLAGMNIRASTTETGFVGDLLSRRYGFFVFAGALVFAMLLWRALEVGRQASEYEAPAPPAYRESG